MTIEKCWNYDIRFDAAGFVSSQAMGLYRPGPIVLCLIGDHTLVLKNQLKPLLTVLSRLQTPEIGRYLVIPGLGADTLPREVQTKLRGYGFPMLVDRTGQAFEQFHVGDRLTVIGFDEKRRMCFSGALSGEQKTQAILRNIANELEVSVNRVLSPYPGVSATEELCAHV